MSSDNYIIKPDQSVYDSFNNFIFSKDCLVFNKLIKKTEIYSMVKSLVGDIVEFGVFKGETANFDLISNAITNGIMQLSIIKKKPIGNSIITAFNREQGMKRFHRGEESAKAVLKVLKIK